MAGPPLSPVFVTLRGRDRPIRFTIAALEEFENETGTSIGEAFGNKPALAIKIRDIVTALHIGIKYGGSDGNLSRDRIRAMIENDLERGVLVFAQMVEQLVLAIQRATAFRGAAPPEDEAEGENEPPFASAPGAPPPNPAPTSSSD
jgi:hypothetical protein